MYVFVRINGVSNDILESRSKSHFGKKCRVFSAGCWLPTKVAWKLWVIDCCWGAF